MAAALSTEALTGDPSFEWTVFQL